MSVCVKRFQGLPLVEQHIEAEARTLGETDSVRAHKNQWSMVELQPRRTQTLLVPFLDWSSVRNTKLNSITMLVLLGTSLLFWVDLGTTVMHGMLYGIESNRS